MRIFVCNFPFETAAMDLKEWFSEFGKVVDTVVCHNPDTGKARGFGFVVMSTREQGERAIEALNGSFQADRRIQVKEAKPRAKRACDASNLVKACGPKEAR